MTPGRPPRAPNDATRCEHQESRLMPPLSRSGRLARPSSRRRRPRLEALEGRQLLATIPVTTFADVTNPGDGVTSLREAIAKAAAAPGPDDVVLPATINNVQGRYLLSQN